MKQERILLRLVAAVFFAFGIAFMALPATLFPLTTETSLPSGPATIDVRATYGGLSLAVGILLSLLVGKPALIRLGLLAVAVLLLCMASGRLLGIFLDGDANVTMYLYLVLEVVTAAVALVFLKRPQP